MPGTISGGKLGARNIKLKYGNDYYRRIGAMGGKKSRNCGFYTNRELASRAGKIGGKISKRGPAK